MQTSTAILETLDRAFRHPGWAYLNSWHHPPLLVLRRTPPLDGDGRGLTTRTGEPAGPA